MTTLRNTLIATLMMGLLLVGGACAGVDPMPTPPQPAKGKADRPQTQDDCGHPGLPCCEPRQEESAWGLVWVGTCDEISFCGEISGSCIPIEEG